MTGAVYISNHSIGLDNLTRRQQADHELVLDILRREGRFSSFEAASSPTIARTMTALCKSRLTTDPDSQYPWTNILAIDGVPMTGQEAEQR